MDNNVRELFEYRINIFRDAVSFKKPDRVALMGNTQQWYYLDAGYTIAEVCRDYVKCYDAYRKYFLKYNVDLMYGAAGVRNPTRVWDALGKSPAASIGPDGNSINAIFENELMRADEYDELLADKDKFDWEKALQRNFPNLKNQNLGQYVNAVQEFYEKITTANTITRLAREEFGAIDPMKIINGHAGFINNMMDTYRGIKGLSIDMRRQPEKLDAVCAKYDEIERNQYEAILRATGTGFDMEEPWDVMIGFLAHTILTVKQFERYIYPNLKHTYDLAEELNKQVCMNTEGSILRFADYFNDCKKGLVSAIIEMDDPYEIRKAIPNIAIIGGLETGIMGKGSPEECVDMAKRAIDELGTEGGLILSPNKFVTYKADMKSENLKAVGDFVVDYRG